MANAFFGGGLTRVRAIVAAIGSIRGGGGGREQTPGLIKDGDAIGGEPRRGAGDEIADGAHLSGGQRVPPEMQHDRGGGLILRLAEQLPLGQYKMHARVRDAVQ